MPEFMSDDPDSSTPRKSWLEKISHAFSSEPDSVDDLKQLLVSAARHGIIDTDTLKRLDQIFDPAQQFLVILIHRMCTSGAYALLFRNPLFGVPILFYAAYP